MVTPELVATLTTHLPPGKKVYLKSDVKEVMEEMKERFGSEEGEGFEEEEWGECLGVETEREVSVRGHGLPVHMAVFRRKG